jgi:hypothetical protein
MPKKYFTFFYPVLFSFFTLASYAQCDNNDSTTINGNFIIGSDTTLSGIFSMITDFHVLPGITVTVDPISAGGCGGFKIYAETIVIEGTINADGAGNLGGGGGAEGTMVSSDPTGNESGLTGCSNSGSTAQLVVEEGKAGINGDVLGVGFGKGGKDGSSGSGPKQHCTSSDDAGMVGGAAGGSGGGGGSYGGLGTAGSSGGDGGDIASITSASIDISSAWVVVAGGAKSGGNAGVGYGTPSGMDIAYGSGGGGAGGGGRS